MRHALVPLALFALLAAPTSALAVSDDQVKTWANAAAKECAANADAASKHIFEALVADEEGHFEAFDTQLEHLKRFGPNYLALQALGKESGEGEGAA